MDCQSLFRSIMLVLTVCALVTVTQVSGQEPAASPTIANEKPSLHQTVDQLLVAPSNNWIASPVADGLFLRRLSLDLRGSVPTGDEIRAFIADQDTNKRAAWTRRFMSDPLHQERMVDWLDKTLMMRRPASQVDRGAWIAWLRGVVERRVPLDGLVREMLTATWWDNSQRPALRFFLDRSGDPHLITRDLSRVLLGRDMQCNQCHNHPLIEEYKQVDYHGLLAFVSGSSLVEATSKNDKGADVKTQMYVERPGADAPFESVFEKGVAIRTLPRLPVSAEVSESYLEPDQRLAKETAAGSLTGVPKPPVHSRRKMLADEVLQKQTRVFARNFANRLWALAFGRGVVHPLDMHHADNPPWHPELLERLTDALIEMQFDADRFLEQLVLTEAYRRGGELPWKPWIVEESCSVASRPNEVALQQIDAMRALATQLKEQWTSASDVAKESVASEEKKLAEALAQWLAAQGKRHAARTELDKAEAAFNDIKKKSDDAAAAQAAAQKKHQDNLARITLLDEAQTKLQQAISLSGAADAELTSAINTAKARADAARGQTAALEKAIADTTAAAATALAAVDAPRAQVKQLAIKLDEENKALAPVDQAYAAARGAWATQQSLATRVARMLEATDHALALVAAADRAREAIDAAGRIQADQVALKAKITSTESQIAEAEAKLAASKAELVTAESAVATATKSKLDQEGEITQLRETVKLLEKSSPLVAMPEPLAKAIASINESITSKSSSSGQLAASLSAAEQKQSMAAAQVKQSNQALTDLQSAHRESLARLDQLKQSIDQSTGAFDEAKAKAVESWSRVQEVLTTSQSLFASRPLSPEQMGHSLLRVTGVFDNYVTAELTELNKNSPLPENADDAAKAARTLQAVRGASDKLRGNIDVFANLYSSGAGQTSDDFFASPDQALYMSNAGAVFAWSAASGQNLAGRMLAEKDNAAAAADLYTTLLARAPTASEQQLVVDQLSAAGDARAAVCQELVWAVLSGVEFRFYR